MSRTVAGTEQFWWNVGSQTDLPSLLRTSFRGLVPATLGNFIQVNAFPFDESLIRGLDVEVISDSASEQLQRQGWFWTEFYKKYPTATGYIQFWNVGFDADQRQALAY